MRVTVKQGTDKRWPSIRVVMDGYLAVGDVKTEQREIALVFKKGEAPDQMRQAAVDAAKAYVASHPVDAIASVAEAPLGQLDSEVTYFEAEEPAGPMADGGTSGDTGNSGTGGV